MRVPECPDCGETEGLCRDVVPGTNPRLVWREIKCNNCGARRTAFMGYLPDEFRDVTLKELSEDRLLQQRDASYGRRGKGVYRRSDTLIPATVHVWVTVKRRGRRAPVVGHAGRVSRGEVHAERPAHAATSVTNTPLYSEPEEAAD